MDRYSSPIEKLPENILLRILLSLPLVDAVATRPLSRRWNKLWERSCSLHLNLCFDVENLFDFRYRKRISQCGGLHHGISSEVIEDFVKGVDMIVQRRRGLQQDALMGVNSLEIRFHLPAKQFNHLDNWISSTVSSATKQLILVLYIDSTPSPPSYSSTFCEFHFEILVAQKCLSLEHLQLEYITVKIPQNFFGFPSLRTLKLNFVKFNQESFLNMLNNCPMLESLDIYESRDLVALHVSSPLPRLKVLVIQMCNALTSIDLWAENLSSFDYDSPEFMEHLVLKDSHNLTKVAVRVATRIRDYFRPLFNDLPFVSTLYLNSRIEDLSVVLTGSRFTHLRFLAIFVICWDRERDIQNISSLLNGFAPMLEELELHHRALGPARRFEGNNNQRIDGGYNYLKRVAFTGFTGDKDQKMLAKYFLRKARRLQVMTLDTVLSKFQCHSGSESRNSRYQQEM